MTSTNNTDTATVTCRLCGTQNRFPIEKALNDLTKVVCGSCRAGLLRVSGEPLTDLANEHLAHPWDRDALDKLRAIPYADEIISKVLGSTLDKLGRFRHYASAVRVTERQAPKLHRMYLEAAGRVDVDPPPLFIVQHPSANAYTSGAKSPIVAITTGLIELMDERSIVGVLGHELTHVRLGHVLYRTLAFLLARGVQFATAFLGLGNLVLGPLKAILFKWYQMSELSADRGELIATGSLGTHVRTQMMLAGGSPKLASELDIAAFIDQAHEAEAMRDGDVLINISEMFAGTERTHPLSVWRVHHALQWARSQAFFDLLAGTPRPAISAAKPA